MIEPLCRFSYKFADR